MSGEQFHQVKNSERRGADLPARSGIASRRGVTLVELLISMLILTIVCLAWLEIIGIQSARKEARRREAVERLVGMMDAFLYEKKAGVSKGGGGYEVTLNLGLKSLSFKEDANTNIVHPVFDDSDVSPIGYQLCVVEARDVPNWSYFESWGNKKWLIGRLYDGHGKVDEVGRPFFTLSVYLGLK